MNSTCANCHRSSKQSDGWWEVAELLRTYELCPSCYRMRSLQAQRERIIERVETLNAKHPDTAVAMGMRLMQTEVRQLIKDMNHEA